MLAPSPLRPVATLSDDELRATVADLARDRAQLDAREAEVLAEFNQRQAFVVDGQLTAKSWLVHHTGVASATAGSRVSLAQKLRHMTLLAELLAAGSVTVDHARVMARALKPSTYEAFLRDERLLAEHATTFDADDFALVMQKWLLVNEPGLAGAGQEASVLYVSPMLEGRQRLDGELDLEDSAEFLAELDCVYDELWRQDQDDVKQLHAKSRAPAELRAAALVEIARRSSAAGDRDTDCDEAAAPSSTVRRSFRRSQFVVVVDPPALEGQRFGTSELEDGTNVAQEMLQRWACDTAVGRVVMSGPSIPLDIGKLTYTATDGQRRALKVRDRGCAVRGCKRKARWCEAHHVIPWPNGPTNLENLVLLCRRHHKLVHRRVIKFLWNEPDQRWQLVRASDNTPLLERPPPHTAKLFDYPERASAVLVTRTVSESRAPGTAFVKT